MRFLVLYRRFDGVATEVGGLNDYPNRIEASLRVQELLEGWIKPHHGSYEIVEYQAGRRIEILKNLHVAPYIW